MRGHPGRALAALVALVALVGTTAPAPVVAFASTAPALVPIATTGPPTPAGMQPWVTAAEQVMQSYSLPGASLAVAYEGRVVLEKGLGFADLQTHTLVQPGSGFRLASVSKPLTATLIGILISEHKLSLSTRPFATILRGLRGPGGAEPVDPRIFDITVYDLLMHQGGWDIDALGYDPVFHAGAEEHALGLRSPPTCEDAIRFMLGVKLNFAPGTQTRYSNFGFCVLADTIAHITGLSYAQAAQQLLFDQLGMHHTEQVANNLNLRQAGEVHYYGQADEVTGPQSPYQLNLAAAMGAATWVSTAPDLERFLIGTTGAVPGSIPFPSWPLEMVATGTPPPAPVPPTGGPAAPGQGYWWFFDGSLPGTSTEVGAVGPITYVMLANSRDPLKATSFGALQDLAEKWWREPASVWPSGNLLSPPAV
jgi:N-acyl-D-amino-acid deacylase